MKLSLQKVYKYKFEHDIPARWFDKTEIRYLPEALGYSDFQHIPDELWICINCGTEFRNIEQYPCLYKLKKLPRLCLTRNSTI